MIRVRIACELVTQMLTEGYRIQEKLRVTAGLAPGAELLAAGKRGNDVVLFFAENESELEQWDMSDARDLTVQVSMGE